MKDNKKATPNIMTYLILAVLLTLLFNAFISYINSETFEEVQYNEFRNFITQNKVEKVEIESDRLLIWLKEETETEPNKLKKTYYTGYIFDADLLPMLNDHGISYGRKVTNNNPVMDIVMTWVLPIAIIYGLSTLLLNSVAKRMGGGGRGGFMSFGQSTAKVYLEKRTGITFDDVAGQSEAKESLTEIVDFLHNPGKYTAIGAKQPKGALLVGPPGTGKTLIAKAVAGEANVAFFSLSGSDFVEMFVGVGASRVRDLFKQAAQHAPCIIFIDEIDAIGKSRDNAMGGNDEREQTLNQLLAEMDGFDSTKAVVILAATNRPEILDKALLRPGRFDRRIIVERPDLKGREDILGVHVKKVKTDTSIDLKKVALATPMATGADLANIVNEAALAAVRAKRDRVCQTDLMDAVEVVIAGKEKKDRIMNEREKRIVAYHEVGHALVTALQKDKRPVQKITIIPRTSGALGYILKLPEDEHFIESKDDMLSDITTAVAGRAAEEIVFGIRSSGAANDIEQATNMAMNMVNVYGMSDEFDMMGLSSVQNKYLDGRMVSNVSDITRSRADKEVQEIIRDCHRKATDILKTHMDALRDIAEFLINKETITGDEFMDILSRYTNLNGGLSYENA